MVAEPIAVATVSGKAYYIIVSELKKRRISFLSLRSDEAVPLGVKVVITTASEREKVDFPHILIFEDFKDTEELIERALMIIQNKDKYEEVIVGVDPGKRLGIAITADGKVLKVLTTSSICEATSSIIRILEIIGGDRKVVKIGNGAKEYQKSLSELLDKNLTSDVLLESVEEYRTTKASKKAESWRKDLRDGISAIEITRRSGRIIKRNEKSEHTGGKRKSSLS
ncbi:MAG: hypothetical protein QG670_211 [Thermoproteota archaeon]|nr:hypothetical protein [Thermoproteota archaeon]